MGLRGRSQYDPLRRAQAEEQKLNERPAVQELVGEVYKDSPLLVAMVQELLRGKQKTEPTPISLPRHMFNPDNVPSLDFRRACLIPANTTAALPFLLFEFTCPQGSVAVFTHYAIYCDGLDEDLVEFLPAVDGSRIFPYHGNPAKNFKMGLGLGPDLSNTCLIPANLKLFPGQTLRISAVNLDPGVSSAMGARFVGYLDNVNLVEAGRFGS